MKNQMIQVARALAAYMVVFHHLQPTAARVSGLDFPRSTIGAAGVDVFFVISGFIMVYVTHNKTFDLAGFGSFARKRLVRIMPLYMLMTLIAFGVASYGLLNWPTDTNYLLSSLFLWIDLRPGTQNTWEPLIFQGWTLRHEFFFYLLFGLSLLAGRSRYFVCCLLIFFSLYLGTLIMGTPLQEQLLHKHKFILLEFVYGVAIGAIWVNRSWTIQPKPALLIGTLGLLVSSCLLFVNDWRLFNVEQFFRPLHWGVPAALMVISFLLLEEANVRSRIMDGLSALGDWSYSIYLNHVMVIMLLGVHVYTDPLIGIPALDYALFVGLVFALSAAFGAITFYLVEQPLARFSSRIGKSQPSLSHHKRVPEHHPQSL